MDPMPKNTKFHFTHPNHPLIYLSDDQDYFCDGCKTFGSDSRYRCHGCDFDLHEYCANCPEKLSSFIHHHPLTLNIQPLSQPLSQRFCDICLDPIDGLFYCCNHCGFDAHPICTQLPQQIDHDIDHNHSLNLQKLPFGRCVVCRTDCSSIWVYGCDVCRLYIHLDCLFEPYESSVPAPSETASRGMSFAPPPPRPPPVPYGFAVPHAVYPSYQASHYQYGYAAPPPLTSPPPPTSSSQGRKLRKSMFYLVGRLAMGVVTSSICGTPLSF